MKKIYLILAIFIFIFNSFCCFCKPVYAYTQPEYRRVIDKTTPFYKSTIDQSPLFYLPYTYYVKVLGQVNDFCHVEIHGDDGYVAIDGYVPTNYLFIDGLEVLSPYLAINISTINTTVLYADSALSLASQYVFAERTLFYFGEYSSTQGKIFYVSYNNKLGYVKECDIFPFTITEHPNELTFLTPPEEEINTPKTQENLFDLKSIIIVCLTFAGIIALFIAFSNKSKHNKNPNYYEENDYE